MRRFWLIAIGLVFAGCLAKPPTPGEVLKQALPQSTGIPQAWDQAAPPGEVDDDWLASFGDPVLDGLVVEALENNTDLHQAAAVVAVAKETVVVVGSRLKPRVGAKIGGATTKDFGSGSPFYTHTEYAGLVWEIDVWGRLRSQREAAQQDFEAADLDYRFARLSLVATTAKLWYQASEVLQIRDLAAQAVQIYTELLELVDQRRAGGKVSDFEVMQARAALAMAQGDLRAADADYDAVRRALELLLGRYPGAEIEARGDFVPVPPPVAAGVPASLIERRPDLVSAERQVIAAFRLQKAAKLALLPSIAIQVDGGRLSEKLLSLLSLNPTLLHAAIGMEIPIYEGGKLRAQIRIATAEQAGAVAQYGTATLQAFGEVENALTGEVTLVERLRFEEQALQDLDETVRLARIRFLSGAGDLLTVLLYQTAQLERHANVIQLRNAQLANRIDLHLALGGSFEELAAPIDEDGG